MLYWNEMKVSSRVLYTIYVFHLSHMKKTKGIHLELHHIFIPVLPKIEKPLLLEVRGMGLAWVPVIDGLYLFVYQSISLEALTCH